MVVQQENGGDNGSSGGQSKRVLVKTRPKKTAEQINRQNLDVMKGKEGKQKRNKEVSVSIF